MYVCKRVIRKRNVAKFKLYNFVHLELVADLALCLLKNEHLIGSLEKRKMFNNKKATHLHFLFKKKKLAVALNHNLTSFVEI